ncbi:DUF3039 domain-containing protein [Corynebacterium sp. CCUG 51687]|uniref:DUF3039 domain-containing protein n=1 Tax=Corynebacterium TaxID=1716 RepID=UPI00210C3806|nr:DUF3039 domain-containing protein [Corynebacterium sp. CCUG 51687]MCQ4613087.1 DUF3039 domain-containing protein [Corynebacterium sp. CCUG 51687]
MHNRRARPTIRVLKRDLSTDWENPFPQRALERDDLDSLHPLSDLPHPLIEKAKSLFSEKPEEDGTPEEISSATNMRLWKVKISQWRGGVWEDADGVRWLVVAGLAKGQHEDHDDFYEKVKQANDNATILRWQPTEQDKQLLRLETAAGLRTEWELCIQRLALEALTQIHSGGKYSFTVSNPLDRNEKMATIILEVTPEREGIESDDFFLEIKPENRFVTDPLIWVLTLRLLSSIDPPEQHWDRYGDTYSNMGEPGCWTCRKDELEQLVAAEELAFSEPGKISHYAHRKHLVRNTVEGKAVSSLCGTSFVPQSDHEKLPMCPECQKIYEQLPRFEKWNSDS